MFYVGILLILFLIRFVSSQNPWRQRNLYYFVFVFLFLFSAFRYEVGCDWIGYYLQFTADVGRRPVVGVFEQEGLWWGLLDYVRGAELPYPVVNVISSAIFFVGIHALARRQPDRLAFLIFLFPILIINMPMSAIRQGAAIGLICIAFCAFMDRRSLRFLLWILLASGFHSSALSFLLLLPLTKGEYSRRNLFLTGILAIPGVFLLTSGSSFQIAVERYVETEIDAAGALFRVALLVITGVYFFAILRQSWREKHPKDFGIVNLGAIGMLLLVIVLPISTVISDRLGYYLIPIQAMIFARLPTLFPDNLVRKHAIMPYGLLLVVFVVWSYLSWHFQVCYIPYQTWLFGFPEFHPY